MARSKAALASAMCEKPWGKFPTRRPRPMSYSSESSPTSFARDNTCSKSFLASSTRPISVRLLTIQKLQARKTPSPGRQAIVYLHCVVSHDQAIGHQILFNCVDCAFHPLVIMGQEADQRHQQQRCVELIGAIGLNKAAQCPVVCSRADLRMNLRPHLFPLFDRRLGGQFLGHPDRAVEGDPGHHLGVGKVLWGSARLPDALIGLFP